MTNPTPLEPLAKAYEPESVEQRLYAWWESSGFFKARPNPDKEPFTIIMPPPNVTGQLHLGHAQRTAVEDSLVRYHRMSGYETLWLPGKDHAGIATQMVVERSMESEGLTRHDLGREAFVERIWEWVRKYGDVIDDQIRRLGASCDWERLTFTLDPGVSRAVRTTFKKLYDKGLIYRGERMINWCVGCRTALSDLEVDHFDEEGALYHIRYPLESGAGYVTVATTRPETMLGDTAVAVHPDDPRYTAVRGQQVLLPILGRPIPLIEDTAVAMDFGSGALKITPGHDPNDFETGQRHDLPNINILNLDGTLNENAGPYEGYDRFDARKAIVEQLEREGLLEKVEPHVHSVGHCQRSSDIVEPLFSEQWFVDVKPLADRALEAVRDGRITIVPDRFGGVYANWMENIRDWCISRQLWWGHRIPVWYCAEHGHVTVAIVAPTACEECGSTNLTQDEDVLDTWFSSGLWPHSTLGWPDQTEELAYFYPSSVMETGHDILFFWVARMIMLGLENMDDVPFKTVYLSGLVRDEHGVKMSKTKGNVIDPLEAIAEYGTDALRLALTTGTAPGNDTRLSEGRLQAARNFSNKLWNVSRYVLTTVQAPIAPLTRNHPEDRWILTRTEQTAARVNDLMEDWQIGEVERVLNDFVWNEFADWYIELAKVRLRAGDDEPRAVLIHVLDQILRMLHPFMPFITEELWQHLQAAAPTDGHPASIMTADYPDPRQDGERLAQPNGEDAAATANIELMIDVVRAIRNVRAEFHVEPNQRLDATISVRGGGDDLASEAEAIRQLAKVGKLTFGDTDATGADTVKLAVRDAAVSLAMGGAVDIGAETARLESEAQDSEKYIAGLGARLSNEQFVSKAPAEVVERERQRLEDGQAQLDRIRGLLAELGH
jgi:valyl-tRNA synthetase